MAVVETYTKEKIDQINDVVDNVYKAGIASAEINGDGDLILTKNDDTVINAGQVRVPGTPTGSVIMFGGSSPPDGWLMCNGQAVSRTTYGDLFYAIGTAFGAGDGSSTFNLPSLEGRFPRMESGALGSTGGSNSHTHTVDDHLHTVGSHFHTVNGHDHNLEGGSEAAAARIHLGSSGDIFQTLVENLSSENRTQRGSISVSGNSSGDTAGSRVTGFTAVNGNPTNTAGGDTSSAGNDANSTTVRPPYQNVNFIIKT